MKYTCVICALQVLDKSKEQRHRTLQTIAHHVRVWTVKVLKLKAVYMVMNKFLNEGQNYVAECWLPYGEYGSIQAVLQRASVRLFPAHYCIMLVRQFSNDNADYICQRIHKIKVGHFVMANNVDMMKIIHCHINDDHSPEKSG